MSSAPLPLPAVLLSLMIFMLLPSATPSELKAHFVENPEPISAPIGDKVVFSCQTNLNAERLSWRYRPAGGGGWRDVPALETPPGQLGLGAGAEQPTPTALRVTSKERVSKLIVHLHNESLAGDYRCIARIWSYALLSVGARLGVARLGPMPKLPDQHLQIALGGRALIRCPPPTSDPPATILYHKLEGNQEFLVVNGVDGSKEGGGAVLVRPRRRTIYTCSATNDLTQQTIRYSHKITVDVRDGDPVQPKFTDDMPKEVYGLEGGSIVIACGAVGRPVPKISWKKLGGTLPDRASASALLEFANLNSQHEGTYICEASNTAGRREHAVQLLIQSRPSITPTGEHGKEKINNEVWGSEGSSITLFCGKVQGKPTPTIEWVMNGEEVINDRNVKVLDTFALEINPVEKHHAGLVQCFATNTLGSASVVQVLRVMPKQHVSQDGNEDTRVSEIGITRPGAQGGSVRRHQRPKGRHRGYVMIPPSQPNVTRLSDESVMVRWTVKHNSGLPIQFFKVQYRDLNQSAHGGADRGAKWKTSNQDVPTHVRSYEVEGLQPDHVYKFRIAAVYSNNDNNLGNTSNRFYLQRGAGLASVPPTPQLIKVEAISPTEIELHWQLSAPSPSSYKETPVEGFYVYYRQASTAGEYVKAAVEGGKAQSYILRHLASGSPYEIKLQSFTHAAASNFSAIVTERTQKAPVVEKIPEVVSTMNNDHPRNEDTGLGGSGKVYLIAGGAAGGLAVLGAVILGIIIYKKKHDNAPDKQRESGVGAEMGNGYLPPSNPPKPAITITSNPLHPEGENVDLEMSYISAKNNNCSSQSPRASAELAAVVNTCRDELRKQSPMSSMSARENYV